MPGLLAFADKGYYIGAGTGIRVLGANQHDQVSSIWKSRTRETHRCAITEDRHVIGGETL